MPGALSSRVCKIPHLLKGSAGTIEIVVSPGSTSDIRVSLRPYLITSCDENITAETFVHIYNHKGEEDVSPFIRVPLPRLDQSGGVAVTSFQEYIWGGHD